MLMDSYGNDVLHVADAFVPALCVVDDAHDDDADADADADVVVVCQSSCSKWTIEQC